MLESQLKLAARGMRKHKLTITEATYKEEITQEDLYV